MLRSGLLRLSRIALMKTLLRPLLALASLTGTPRLRAAPWSLTQPPAVPAPAAPNSKPMREPRDVPEIKLEFPIAPGPFEPTWESIRRHYPGPPAWFNDAKFGVFVHWGPQASGRSGDWYARNLYREGSVAYQNHLKNFGHPSEFGYKDVLHAWKAPKWDAAATTRAFADAGMRFMMVVGVHHDNYDLWNSRHQPWNSVNVGPRKDMIGAWAKEARGRGMRFGITFHHEYTWWWWVHAFHTDTQGPKAGVPYDGGLTLADGKGKWWQGLDPRLLYTIDLREYTTLLENRYAPAQGLFQDHTAYGTWYAEWWARRIQDAIEQHDPDFFYTDGNAPEPFSGLRSGTGLKSDAGRRVVAHFYNRSLALHGKVDGIAFVKFQDKNPAVGMTAEEGVPPNIKRDQPWIGENPIGDWYWGPNYCYEPINLIRSLLEYTSRGGNYACAVPLTPEGDLEPACVAMLQEIGAWMRVNGAGIYGSTAWKTWGEGDPRADPQRPNEPGRPLIHRGKLTQATAALPFNTSDFRFTLGPDGALYAWCMTVPKPGETLRIRSLGRDATLLDQPIASVALLGGGRIRWEQGADALTLECPSALPFKHAVGFRVTMRDGPMKK
jgi:alpha-L-fucosidase